MSFIEIRFLLFVLAVILLYYILPKKIQWIVLLAASLIFYLSYGWEKLPFIVASSLIAWLTARYMERNNSICEEENAAKQKNKPVIIVAIILLAGLLLYAKIGTWVAESMAAMLSLDPSGSMNAIVALGVSYYTFSLIAYIADVYWRKDKAEKNYFRFLLFVVYFPKILQGPISRHDHLAPQLREIHHFNYTQFCYGIQRMVWGYFKKMVIADRLAVVVRTVFVAPEKYSGSICLVALIFATFQLYCDFSGCMDIVGGLSQTLGLMLEENFKRPFFSKSVAEFWRRWHATLGSWMREYIYIPLGGGRCAKWKKICNALIVWLLVGLWHGTGWNYVAWGIYWGILAACNVLFGPALKKLTVLLKINTEAGSWKVFQMVRTFALFVGGRILTVPGNLRASLEVMRKILFEFKVANLLDGTLFTLGLDRWNFIFGIIFLLVLWGASLLQERGSIRERIAGSNIVFRWAIYYIAFFTIIIFGMYGPGFNASSFIYMNY